MRAISKLTRRYGVTVLTVALISMTAAAQSGRRLPKSAPTPVPSPQPVPATKPAEKPKPALKLIVGAEQRGFISGLPSYLTSSVLKACAERLDAAPSVDVTVSHRDVNRGEAIKTAKAEKEAFVVWLQLGSDRGYGAQTDINDLYLQYVVFAPMTAKIAANGRTYPQGYGSGGVIMNPGRLPGGNNLPYIEQALKNAARAAAERILDALIAELPGERTPG